jgi:hypothetical protein
MGLAEGAQLAPGAAGIAIALAGPWLELRAAGDLPPVADLSVPPATRSAGHEPRLEIDDLLGVPGAAPSGYVRAAEVVVARKSAEYGAWLADRAARVPA